MTLRDPAERVTVVSMLATTFMGTVEFLAGLLFGSVAFVAAGVDAIADTATSVGVLAGLRMSKRPPDAGHPYGHRQAETLASLGLAAVLLLAGVRVAYSAVERLQLGAIVEARPELFLLAGASIFLLGALADQKIRIGKRTGNMSVVADGYHTLSDSASASAVLVGLVLVRQGYPVVDPVVALGISALITWWSLRIGRDALNVLMGVSPGPGVMANIREVCRSVPGVLDCHRCRARRVGSRILADLHVLVDPEMSIGSAHEIATKVERRLKAKVKGLASVVVHVEPQRRKPRG
jgi:cation diffusion facilitator family transporter